MCLKSATILRNHNMNQIKIARSNDVISFSTLLTLIFNDYTKAGKTLIILRIFDSVRKKVKGELG
jgi:hypothetical protein